MAISFPDFSILGVEFRQILVTDTNLWIFVCNAQVVDRRDIIVEYTSGGVLGARLNNFSSNGLVITIVLLKKYVYCVSS